MQKLLLLLTFFVFSFAKTFTVAYDPDYSPFSYSKDNKAEGVFIDIWKFWAKKNGYKIKFINGKTWDNAINLAKEGKVDFFIGTYPYEGWMEASKPFYQVKTALFVRDDFHQQIRVVGIIGSDYADDILSAFTTSVLKSYFKKSIEIKSYKTYEALFQALQDKKVDAIYDDYLALIYFAIKHQYMFIKQLDRFTISSDVRAISNNKENIEIFNKGLEKISQKDFYEITKKWDISIENKRYIKIFVFIIVGIILIILIFMIINARLKKVIQQKTKDLEELNKNLEAEVLLRTKELEAKTLEAQHSAKAKARFLANMSHEIRTPLNSIIGFASLLQEEKLDKSAQNYVNIIEKASKSLLGVINDILDFSKIEEGKLSIEKINFYLDDEIENIAQLFYQKADEKHIMFKIEKNNLDSFVITDPTRLKQVILNLLSNAFKFTDENKTIELKVDYDGKNINVSVKDEGIGIAQNKLKHIFEDFTQADDSTTRKYGGTGLGLSISASLIKLLGGELKVKSKEKEGSEFYFSIPAKKAQKIEKKQIVKFENKQFKYHVLLVEDNKANQMFMQVILKKLGLTFDIANDGLEAVKIYENNYKKYDLILMDENMPNMTGRVATSKIRQFERANDIKSIFIVALTANALTGDKEKFIKAGMNDYLSKPLNVEKLIVILKKLT